MPRMLDAIVAIAKDDPEPLVSIPVRSGKVVIAGVPCDVYVVDARGGLSAAQQAEILNIADGVAKDGYNVTICFLFGESEARKLDYVVILAGRKGGGVRHPRLENAVSSGMMQRWSGEELNAYLHRLFGIQQQRLYVLRGV